MTRLPALLQTSAWGRSLISNPSQVRSHALPRAPEGAVRVELALQTASVALAASPDVSSFSASILADVSRATGASKARLAFVEQRAAGRFVVLDFLPPGPDGDQRKAKALALELGRLATRRPLPLRPLVGTGAVGLALLTRSGMAIPLVVSEEALTAKALKFTVAAGVVLGSLFVCLYTLRLARAAAVRPDHAPLDGRGGPGSRQRKPSRRHRKKSHENAWPPAASDDSDFEPAGTTRAVASP